MKQSPQSFAGLSLAEKRMLLAELLREKAKQDRPSIRWPTDNAACGSCISWTVPAAPTTFFSPPASAHASIRAAFRRALQTLIDRHPACGRRLKNATANCGNGSTSI